MTDRKPPLSPHVQVYAPQLTSVLSFAHRVTGMFLGVAAVGLVGWLAALAAGPASYATARDLLAGIPGQLVLFVTTLVFYCHLCNGVRHLFWDTVRGFELRQIYASGWAVVLTSIALTILTSLVVGIA